MTKIVQNQDQHTVVGTLATEGLDQTDSDGRHFTVHKMAGRILQNDGGVTYWMSVAAYQLRHDGQGWRVTAHEWAADGHVYRLADPTGTFVTTVPLASGGEHQLEPGYTYGIRKTGSTWELTQQ